MGDKTPPKKRNHREEVLKAFFQLVAQLEKDEQSSAESTEGKEEDKTEEDDHLDDEIFCPHCCTENWTLLFRKRMPQTMELAFKNFMKKTTASASKIDQVKVLFLLFVSTELDFKLSQLLPYIEASKNTLRGWLNALTTPPNKWLDIKRYNTSFYYVFSVARRREAFLAGLNVPGGNMLRNLKLLPFITWSNPAFEEIITDTFELHKEDAPQQFLQNDANWSQFLQNFITRMQNEQLNVNQWFEAAFENIRICAKGLFGSVYLDHVFISVPPPVALFQEIINRLREKQVLGLIAPPGWGKSRMVLWIALWLFCQGIDTIFFEEPQLMKDSATLSAVKAELERGFVCVIVDDFDKELEGPSNKAFEDLINCVNSPFPSYILFLQTERGHSRSWPRNLLQVVTSSEYCRHWTPIWRLRFMKWFTGLKNTPVSNYIDLPAFYESEEFSDPWGFVSAVVDLQGLIDRRLDKWHQRVLLSLLCLGYVISGEEGISCNEVFTGVFKFSKIYESEWKRIKGLGGKIWASIPDHPIPEVSLKLDDKMLIADQNHKDTFEGALYQQINDWRAAGDDHTQSLRIIPYDHKQEWNKDVAIKIRHTRWWSHALQPLWREIWSKEANIPAQDLIESFEKIIWLGVFRVIKPTFHQRELLGDPHFLKYCKQIEILRLDLNQLTEIPKELGQLQNLKQLNLNWNQLTEIPKELGQLLSLEYLSLDHNRLTKIPKELGQLLSLEYLNLEHNRLTEIPEELGQLRNLKQLDLHCNQLTEVPPAISQLAQLQYLNLGTNPLTEVPPAISQLAQLQYLNLSLTNLTEVSPAIGQLAQLEYLYLGVSQLTALSPELGQLENLICLDLQYNLNLGKNARRWEGEELRAFLASLNEDSSNS